MKAKWLIISATTIAWFCGSLWYMFSPEGCDCAGRSHAGAPKAQPVQLGPAATTPVVAASILPASAPAPTNADSELPVLTIRFAKNNGLLQLNEEEMEWASRASAMLQNEPGASILISGYTDADGAADVNRDLSTARAALVREALVNLGLPEERFVVVGMGAEDPVADNKTSKGKALNRRVEVRMQRQPVGFTN